MVSAILVTHGKFGEELIATAKGIYGEFDGCRAVTNDGKAPDMLCAEIESMVDAGGEDDNYIVLVDFFGGSCCHACLMVQQKRPDVKLVTGVNLPMLIAFLDKRDKVPFERLAHELVTRTTRSVLEVDPENL